MTQHITLPSDPISTPFFRDIEDLASSVFAHPAMSNRFYILWRKERFSLLDFQVFATNYFRRVYATTERISIALSTIQDWQSRIELLHNLSDELGHGVKENVHVLVLYRWFDSLNRILGSQGSFRTVLESTAPLASTSSFIERTNDLCRRGPQHAAGALLAQEWHGYTQIAYLFEGFRNYQALYEFHEFHDVSEYFYVHLGRAEKEHRKQASVIAARHCTTVEEFAIISKSFQSYMNLLNIFWESIASNLSVDSSSDREHSSTSLL